MMQGQSFIYKKWGDNLSGQYEEGKSWCQDLQYVGMKTITAACLK